MELNLTVLQFLLLLLPLFLLPGIASNAVSFLLSSSFNLFCSNNFGNLMALLVCVCRILMKLVVTSMVHSIETPKV